MENPNTMKREFVKAGFSAPSYEEPAPRCGGYRCCECLRSHGGACKELYNR
jgi:hypothetical protein